MEDTLSGTGRRTIVGALLTIISIVLRLATVVVAVHTADAQCSGCPQTCGSPYCPYQMSGPVDWCTYPSTGCPPDYHVGNPATGNENAGCCCYDYSPILIDLRGGHFKLTSAGDGVVFDITATGHPLKIAWTTPGSDQGWLALDRNGNGLIDNGAELFGNHTPQPQSADPSGFRALAVYDSADAGGNNDGMISMADRIYPALLLWVDGNHDGVSQRHELRTLERAQITQIDLAFKTFARVDRYGNVYRYRAKVTDLPGGRVSRWAWDIFLSASTIR